MRFVLLPLFVLTATAVAAPVPKETEAQKLKRLFGEIADPKKGYDFTLSGDKLVMKMAADASGELCIERTPPRAEREVTGDFELRVVVDLAPPAGRNVEEKGKRRQFVFAGLSLSATDGQNRLHGVVYSDMGRELNAEGWGSGTFTRHLPPSEGPGEGTSDVQADKKFRRFDRFYLLIRREGDRLKLGESADGETWQIGKSELHGLPAMVRVGVTAVNATNFAHDVTFSDFIITPLKPSK